jgi:hypothetical protein
MHSSLLTELAQQRVDDRRLEAEPLRAVALARASSAHRSPWRVVLGVRLIGWGCRLWLSGHRNGPETPPPPAARLYPPSGEAA